ncbi:hypothetical protein GH714_022182 [Hevea brasiliensis]|uniref:beta-galactosidase n=1 Tax=Hevea brasiliensis TaxID=3981 RepID=A0A6A6M3K3_HEVBR|nr:hypothetical protein GH714_022182 [Hevea brasiliensis]
MGWELRYAIAVGPAKGLEYLHHGFDRLVIHRDVKSSNILLDEEWKSRIANFGLAKIVQAGGGDWSHINAGTHGYMAPSKILFSCHLLFSFSLLFFKFDLVRFVKTVQEASLLVHLRIGPYACAEWNYGSIVIVISALAIRHI